MDLNETNTKKEVLVVNEVDENSNDYDDDDDEYDDQNVYLTNMFCATCGSPVIRIKNLDNADFKKISTPEFFQILDLKSNQMTALSLMKSDIQTDFTNSTKISKWSNIDSCILNRKECSKCSTPIAAYVVSSRSESQFKKGEYLFITDMLSMHFDGKLTPLREIASK